VDLKKHVAQTELLFVNPEDFIRVLTYSHHRSSRSQLIVYKEGTKTSKGKGKTKKLRFYHPNLENAFIEFEHDGNHTCKMTRHIGGIGECSSEHYYSDNWGSGEYFSKSLFATHPYMAGYFPNSHERKKMREEEKMRISLTPEGMREMMRVMLPPVYRLALEFFQEASFLCFAKHELEGEGLRVKPFIVGMNDIYKRDFVFSHRFVLGVGDHRMPQEDFFNVGYAANEGRLKGINIKNNSALGLSIYRKYNDYVDHIFDVDSGPEGSFLITKDSSFFSFLNPGQNMRFQSMRRRLEKETKQPIKEMKQEVVEAILWRSQVPQWAQLADNLEAATKKHNLVTISFDKDKISINREGRIAELKDVENRYPQLSVNLWGTVSPLERERMLSLLNPLMKMSSRDLKREISRIPHGARVCSEGYFKV
jgi:hypothetical protein